MKKETKQVIIMVIVILLICMADNLFSQELKVKPYIDTIENKRVLIDKDGKQYEIFKSENNRSFIVKNEKKVFLFRKPEIN